MGASASTKYEVGGGGENNNGGAEKEEYFISVGQGQQESSAPRTSLESLVNSALHDIVARTAAMSSSLEGGASAPRTSIKEARKSWKSATDVEGLGRPPAGQGNQLSEKTLPRINSIQSIALGHKLKRLGSYSRMGYENGEDVTPDMHVKLAGAFASGVKVLDPLQKMKRISSTPIMRGVKNHHAVPKMTASNSGNEGSSISPTPLSQIHELENESYPPSPIKGGVVGGPPSPAVLDEGTDVGNGNKFGLTVVVADDEGEEGEKEKQDDVPPITFPKLTLLRTASFEDDDDWLEVSDDENELSMGISQSPRLAKPRLSVHGTHDESYMFTQSGTIFVEGLESGLNPDGENGEVNSEARLPMRDRLVFLEKLGQGASGVVYKALDLVTMRLVAVKIINIYDKAKRRQLVHELGALYTSLRGKGDGVAGSQNILGLIDAFGNVEDATVGLIMEYMDGGSLEDVVNGGGCENEIVLGSMAKQLLSGLDFLHSTEQLHRDVKPANVLINNRGELKVSDFGIAKNLRDDLDSKAHLEDGGAHTFVGTLTYMSPERINGGRYGYAADVWSAGLTLLTTALGKLPLDMADGGYWSVMACVRDDEPPKLPEEDDRWSADFRDFIALCLIKDESKRPTCSELLKHRFVVRAGSIYDSMSVSGLGGDEDIAKTDLEYILEAIFVHTKSMAERGSTFRRAGAQDVEGQQSSTDMLSEVVLKDGGLLGNLADQLGLVRETVEERAKEYVAKCAMRSYLDDSDSD